MIAIYCSIAVAGAALQLWVLHLLAKRWWRDFPVLTFYSLVAFFTSVVNGAAIFGAWHWSKETAIYYWLCEAISQLLVFLTLLELFWKAQDPKAAEKWKILARTSTVGLVLMTIAVVSAYEPSVTRWMTRGTRNLSFVSMLVCFVLWTMLIRRGDRRLLLLCAGLGIPLAGSAIGHALREMSRSLVPLGNLALTLAFLGGQYIWIKALSTGLETVPVQQQHQQESGWHQVNSTAPTPPARS